MRCRPENDIVALSHTSQWPKSGGSRPQPEKHKQKVLWKLSETNLNEHGRAAGQKRLDEWKASRKVRALKTGGESALTNRENLKVDLYFQRFEFANGQLDLAVFEARVTQTGEVHGLEDSWRKKKARPHRAGAWRADWGVENTHSRKLASATVGREPATNVPAN
jgi:hypothetical protein